MADPELPVPSDFAEAERLSVHAKVQTKFFGRFPDLWEQFNGGLGGLLYRFTACAEHDAMFTDSVIENGPGPSQPKRYHQERELFEFFVTGQSAIECLCFSLYALGEMTQASGFDLFAKGKPQRINPEVARDAFLNSFGGQSITSNLALVIGSAEYAKWTATRNILTHRTHPGRTFGIHVGSGHFTLNAPVSGKLSEPVVETASSDSWANWMGISIDAATTRSRREWLARQIKMLLVETDTFMDGLP